MSILTVSQLNNYISFKLKSDLKLKGIMVEGEISNFVNHYKTGHFYFTLKDKTSSIKAIMFSSNASRIKFSPIDGMTVIVSGNIEVFERDGVYQIYITDMQPSGIGGLYLAFEQLKEKLLKEGLFDEKYKKPLPSYPKRIGIVTSGTGAALQDILNILNRRYPIAEVIVYSAIVQGEFSEASLCENLLLADIDNLDVIIIGRGGGSLEDLMAFNSEVIARHIFSCLTPVISAVGHESDTTICDYVSDLRAPTPSAAAELVSPDIKNLYEIIDNYKATLKVHINKKLNEASNITNYKSVKLHNLSPDNMLKSKISEVDKLQKKVYNSYKVILKAKEQILSEKISVLNSLSPLNVLSRGYSLIYKKNTIITDSRKLSVGDEVNIKMSSSQFSATVNKIN